jgi:hypothetical protein
VGGFALPDGKASERASYFDPTTLVFWRKTLLQSGVSCLHLVHLTGGVNFPRLVAFAMGEKGTA